MKGKSSSSHPLALSDSLSRLFTDPGSQMRWEQQWPFQLNPKLMGAWTRAIDFLGTPCCHKTQMYSHF